MSQGPAPAKERASIPSYRSCFAHEWLSVGEHRILVHQRDGAPGVMVRRIAMIAAWTVDESRDTESRVVECWHDNRYGRLSVTIGSPVSNVDSAFLPANLMSAYDAIFLLDPEQIEVKVVTVPDGWKLADAYNHTAHVVRATLKAESKEKYLD